MAIDIVEADTDIVLSRGGKKQVQFQHHYAYQNSADMHFCHSTDDVLQPELQARLCRLFSAQMISFRPVLATSI